MKYHAWIYLLLAFSPAAWSQTAIKNPSGSELIRITPDGKAGILTPTPGANLDVNGAARITSLDQASGDEKRFVTSDANGDLATMTTQAQTPLYSLGNWNNIKATQSGSFSFAINDTKKYFGKIFFGVAGYRPTAEDGPEEEHGHIGFYFDPSTNLLSASILSIVDNKGTLAAKSNLVFTVPVSATFKYINPTQYLVMHASHDELTPLGCAVYARRDPTANTLVITIVYWPYGLVPSVDESIAASGIWQVWTY